MSAAANASASARRNCAPAQADIRVKAASDTTRPSGSISTPNRHTAAAITASGKTDRKALPAPEPPQPQPDDRFAPPQTELELAIAKVWQKVLGLERVDIDEHFFDLGGHSLLLVQAHGALRESLRTEFSIVTLFEHPTIRSLAANLYQPDSPPSAAGEQWRDRAMRQRQALAQLRLKAKK